MNMTQSLSPFFKAVPFLEVYVYRAAAPLHKVQDVVFKAHHPFLISPFPMARSSD